MPGTMPPDYVPQTHPQIDRRAADIAATIDPNDHNLLTTREVAALLGCSDRWVIIGRHKKWGPPFVKMSPRQVRYRRADLLAWLQERTYRSTAENPDNRPSGGRPGPRKAVSSATAETFPSGVGRPSGDGQDERRFGFG